MKTLEQIKTKTEILADLLDNYAMVLPADTTSVTRFDEDLGFDSLDFVELAMEAEKQFKVNLEDCDLEKIKTVGDLVNEIESQINK